MLNITTDIVLSDIERNMILGKHQDIQSSIKEIAWNPDVAHIRLFNKEGAVIYSSDSTEIGKNVFNLMEDMDSTFLAQKKTYKLQSSNLYSSWYPIRNKQECQQCHMEEEIISYLGVDTRFTKAERFFYTGSRHIYFLALLVILILIAGYSIVLQYFISKPFSRFILALGEVEKGNLNITLPAEKKDEIGTLEKHFNRMTGEIKSSQEKIEEMHNEQIQRADKLVTLGGLAAEMAHEINNPAAIIMSRADYLEMETAENRNLEKYAHDLEVIIKQTEKISSITGNILKYSKKLPKDFKNVNLAEIIEESLLLHQHRFSKKNIKVKKELDSLKCFTFGDPLQLEQVFTNLINNAIDAIGSDGTIKISVYLKEKKIYLAISDDGTGIDKDIMDKIYAPFFTTKDAQNGTGIGLYVVGNIIKNHNAEIECKSETDRGTQFLLTFNWAEKNA